jgi:hypothetical protein
MLRVKPSNRVSIGFAGISGDFGMRHVAISYLMVAFGASPKTRRPWRNPIALPFDCIRYRLGFDG